MVVSHIEGHDGVAWSPDSNSLAVLSQTPKIGFHYIHSNIDVCSASGSHHVATLDNASRRNWLDQRWQGPRIPQYHLAGSDSRPRLDRFRRRRNTPGPHAHADGSAIQLSVDAHGNAWVSVARGVQTEIDSFRDNALTDSL